MLGAVAGQVLLVRAPAELRRLAALADETVDRPRVDELAGPLRGRGCEEGQAKAPSERKSGV